MKKYTKIFLGLALLLIITLIFFSKFNKPEDKITFQEAYPFSKDLALIKQYDRYGFIDKTGEFAIYPKYDEATEFFNGISIVKDNNSYGAIDTNGEIIIPFEYQELISRDQNYFTAKKNGLFGVINYKNKVVVDFITSVPIDIYSSTPEHTIAVIYNDSNFQGLIDLNTGFKTDTIYSTIEPWNMNNNMVGTTLNMQFGYINLDTQTEVAPQFSRPIGFSEGLAVATNNSGKSGYIDIDGNYVIEPIYNDACAFSDGLAFVRVDDKYGCINTKGEIIIEPQFDNGSFFSNGVAEIISYSNNHESIYINTSGEIITAEEYYKNFNKEFLQSLDAVSIIPAQYNHENLGIRAMAINPAGEILFKTVYDYIYPVQHNMCMSSLDTKYGLINEKGIEILPVIYDMVTVADENTIIVSENGTFGVIDTMRNEILPFKYKAIEATEGNLIFINQEDKWGYYNLETKELKENLYDEVTPYAPFPIPVRTGEKWFYIDENGEPIF